MPPSKRPCPACTGWNTVKHQTYLSSTSARGHHPLSGHEAIHHLLWFASSDQEQPSEASPELLLDFGSDVPLKSVVKRQLIITSHSAIDAPFTIEVDYFSSGPPPQEEKGSDV